MKVDICSALYGFDILITVPELNGQLEYYITCKDSQIICFSCDITSKRVISCNEVCTEPWYNDLLDVRTKAVVLCKYIGAIVDMSKNHVEYSAATNSSARLLSLRKDLQSSLDRVA